MASPTGEKVRSFPSYALYLLLAVYTFCFLDRQVVNILAEPIKRDLGLSDAQLGLLTGLSFAVLYTVLGLPIARLSDSRNRSRVIVTCLVTWSLFTMLCGMARTLTWLLMARLGVGIGEAGCLPASHSMIADYIPTSRRSWALSVLHTGAPIGILLGMALGGIVAGQYGWRAAFLAAGAPGLLLALITMILLPDPARAHLPQTQVRSTSFFITIGELIRQPGYWQIVLGTSLATFVGYAHYAFIASFFLRAYSGDLAQLAHGHGAIAFLGTVLGITLGVGGIIGTLAGGYWGDRLGRAGVKGYLTAAALSFFIVTPLFLSVVFTHTLLSALACLFVATIANMFWAGPIFAAIQSMVQARSRATAAATALLCFNLLGLGLGPLSIGALSDHLGASFGSADGLRYALAVNACISAVGGILLWMARRHATTIEAAPI